MKKIISCLAIAVMLFACSKEESPVPPAQEITEIDSIDIKMKGITVTTDETSFILPFGATSGGNVPHSGGGNHVTERGVCYSTNPNPTLDDETVISGSGSGTFTSILPGLSDNTTYYVRAYATKIKHNATTTYYGNEVSFTTPEAIYGAVTDIDGNIYATIQIGTQVWMMENLKTSKYRDGTLIPNVTDDVLWAGLSSGAYCNYNNNVNNVAAYGRLYNWFAVDDAHNIAPAGWHVPTKAELQTLVDYVGGSNVAGGKLKEKGYVHWDSGPYSEGPGNNSSGFTAFPGGYRYIGTISTIFSGKTTRGNLWTASTSSGTNNAAYIYLQSSTARVMGSIGGYTVIGGETSPLDKRMGYSVRCVKD